MSIESFDGNRYAEMVSAGEVGSLVAVDFFPEIISQDQVDLVEDMDNIEGGINDDKN
ncbi:hypothetical protein KC867_03165 [Candidatus Saccharibacteria bacterium]|nr:hypothetical protein [Candidatus Saccharibacteria bacterium]